MIIKKVGLISLIGLVFLTGCTVPGLNKNNTEVVKSSPKGTEQSVTVVPQINKVGYKSIIPKVQNPSPTRGYILYGVNNRADVNEMETGLMRLSKPHYNPDTYVFQSGHYIKPKLIESLLSRKDKGHPLGLNPPLGKGKTLKDRAEASPKTLSYILEQDYLKKSGDKYHLAGVSLAISFNQVYKERIKLSNGKFDWAQKSLDVAKVKSIAKGDAKKILDQVRQVKGLETVPIFITLYMESPPDSVTPGYFFADSMIGKNKSHVSNWSKLNEKTVLFPSTNAATNYKGDSDNFDNFKSKIQSYFPNFVGVIGEGFYKNGTLTNLNIKVQLKFYDETEIIGFTQYASMLIQNKFPFSKNIPVQIDVSSIDHPEALIVKDPNMEEPFVHVYR